MKTDRLLGLFFLIFAACMIGAAFDITDLPSATGVSSKFWPLCVLSAMLVLSAILVLKGDGDYTLPWGKIIVCLAFFMGYVLLLKFCGYVIATLAFQIAFLFFLGIRGIKPVVFAVVCTALLTVLFRVVLDVLLPNGEGIFRTFNIMLLG